MDTIKQQIKSPIFWLLIIVLFYQFSISNEVHETNQRTEQIIQNQITEHNFNTYIKDDIEETMNEIFKNSFEDN